MKILIFIIASLALLFYFSEKYDDGNSAFYSYKFGGQRMGILISHMEYNKTKICGSGSISFLWMPDDWKLQAAYEQWKNESERRSAQ
jgi:hypothetical protein